MKKVLLTLMVAATLSACDKKPVDLKGGEYETTYKNGTRITLNFDKERNMVYGRVANSYRGPYEINGSEIKFGMIASTMMMGAPDAMEAERAYHKFLAKVAKFDAGKDSLTLKTADGEEMTFSKSSKE